MAKRKTLASEDESEEYSNEGSSNSDESEPKSKGKTKSGKIVTVKKPTLREESSESESESDEPVAKKAKRNSSKVKKETKNGSDAEAGGSTKVLTNKEGDKYLDLGKKKHATIRVFKGIPLLDIREYYEAGGELKPGKKGISLTLEQWNALRDSAGQIDRLIHNLKK